MAARAIGSQRLAVLVGEEARRRRARGDRDRWQARVEGDDVAHVRLAHAGDHVAQRRVGAAALQVGLDRGVQVAFALRREVGNAGRGALAIQSVAALAVAFRQDLAGARVARLQRGTGRGRRSLPVRATDQHRRQGNSQ